MTTNKQMYSLGIFLAVVVNIFSWHLPFFWDSILTSTITQYFYEHGYNNFIVPAEFDAGHPPLFYIYVTGFYQVFGKNLMAAHLSMLPFTILGIISFIQLLQHFAFSKAQQFFGVVLFFSIPAVITQNTLVSYDAVLLSLYLTALVAYLKNNKFLFSFILIGMVGITLRGLFCLAAISATIFFISNNNKSSLNGLNNAVRHPEIVSGSINKMKFKQWFKWNLYFVPAIIIIGSWYIYHYTQTGWFFATTSQGWSEQRGIVDGFGIFKNGVSIARCFFDFGIFVLSILVCIYFIKKRKIDKYTLLWLIPTLVFSISFLPFTNPINHRYYLIVYVLMLLPVIQFLSERRRIYTVLTILILGLGHFQIYPVPISNGWDCTLAHISFNSGINNVYSYLNRNLINKSAVGSVFPIITSEKQRKSGYSNSSERFINVTDTDVSSCAYLVFSNIGNDFNDKCYYVINDEYWENVFSYQNGLVYFEIYKNPYINPKK